MNKDINAIGIVRQMIADGQVSQEVAEKYFPELAESEDDKIKKDIIQCVKYSGDNFIPCYKSTVGDMISYLEKQGEQKPADKVDPKFKIGDTVIVKPMSCHGKVFKGEPFKIVDIIKDNYVSDDGKTYSISLQDGWELVEQNTAWSEEDELRMNTVCELLPGLDLQQNWLKSLKDRVGNFDDGYKVGFSAAKHNQWKPSDEQIKILNEVLNFAANHESPHWNDYIFGTLNNLIRQLKKLREDKS